ncbi:MAG: hypothetical protein IJ301_02680 [Clostridia bacterium]|nr:hypothetical protein [Clostridia bacterium]
MNKTLNWSIGALCVICLCAIITCGTAFFSGASRAVTYSENFWTSFATDAEKTTATDWGSLGVTGDGSKSSPYLISNANQLAQLAFDVNYKTVDGASVNYAGVYFQLNRDIDLAGYYWVPIGNATRPFKGLFYGNNKTISNMYIDTARMAAPVDTRDFVSYVGLFGYVEDPTSVINMLTIEGAIVNVSVNTTYAGLVAGYFDGAEVRQISVNDTVGSSTQVSSVIRYNLGTTAMTQNTYIGGLVGHLNGQYSTVLRTSSTTYTNDVKTSISSDAINPNDKVLYIGGLVGRNDGKIQQSARDGGLISTFYGVVGGLVGSNNGGSIEDSYNAGDIRVNELDDSLALSAENTINNTTTKDNSTWIGGLAGENRSAISITSAFGSTIFSGVSAQNVATTFQTCRGGIGGIVGLNRSGGTLTGMTNASLVKVVGEENQINVQYMGGIVAVNGGTIKSCVNYGKINFDTTSETAYKAYAIGGIAGVNDVSGNAKNQGLGTGSGMIIGCQNYAEVGTSIDAEIAGGIVGINANSDTTYSITSNESSNTQPVSAVINAGKVRGHKNVGGIVGYNAGGLYGTANLAQVMGVSSESGFEANAGGLVGYSLSGRIEQSFNNANVTNGAIAGGIAGNIVGTTILYNCANYGDVYGATYVGGVAGQFDAGNLAYVLSVGDVNSLDESLTLYLGGVVGFLKPDGSAPSSNIDRSLPFAYSTDIANYDENATNYDNGLSVFGNFPALDTDRKYTSYEMTLPGVDSLTTLASYRSFYQKDSQFNTDWHFEGKNDAEENQITYYYPILTLFKDTLKVFVKTGATAGQTTYPTETIYSVRMYNYEPIYNGTSETYTETMLGSVQYIVSGHKVVEPAVTTYKTYDNYPADPSNGIEGGYTKIWKWKNKDGGTNTTLNDWNFNQTINANTDIVITWQNNVYTLKYFMQNFDPDTQTWGEPVEISTANLLSTITYSKNPAALQDFVLLASDGGYTYEQGWWYFDYMPTNDDIANAGNYSKTINKNTVFDPNGNVYVVGRRTPKSITITMYPGQYEDTPFYFKTTPLDSRTTSKYFGTIFDLSDYTAMINYNTDLVTFKGWYTALEGGVEIAGPDSISKTALSSTTPLTLYAQWTGRFQKVVYFSLDEMGEEQVIRTISVAFNNTTTAPTDLVRYAEAAGYEVDKFFDESGTAEFNFSETYITDTTRILVTWKKRMFNLILDANGGTFADGTSQFIIENVEYKTDIVDRYLVQLGANSAYTDFPTKIGHSRDGAFGSVPWISRDTGIDMQVSSANDNSLMPAYDYTVYMAWSVNRIEIEFVANGGSFSDGQGGNWLSEKARFDYGTPLLNAVESYSFEMTLSRTDDGRRYKLLYWSLERGDEAGETASRINPTYTVPDQKVTLYAIWSPQMTVTFKKLYSIDAWKVVDVNQGETIAEPDTTDEDFAITGFVFQGWFEVLGLDDQGTPQYAESTFDFNQPINENITLCAMWIESDEVKSEPNTGQLLVWVLVGIGVIIVGLFVIILVRSNKKGLKINNKRLHTESSKKKLQEIREIQSRRKDNPFDEDY